jgi:hypothetical protein
MGRRSRSCQMARRRARRPVDPLDPVPLAELRYRKQPSSSIQHEPQPLPHFRRVVSKAAQIRPLRPPRT